MDILNESCYKKVNLLHVASAIAKKMYTYVLWAGHFVCKPDFYIKRENYSSYLLIYTVSGKGTLNYDGKSYELTKNSVMLIDCTKLQEYYPDDMRWEFKYIHFCGPLAKDYYEHITALRGKYVTNARINTENNFDKVLENVKKNAPEELCSQYINSILTDIIYMHREENEDNNITAKISQSISYISDNYAKDINASSLAEAVHLSRCYFTTEFKKHTGISPYEYILNYRLESSKHLIKSTQKSIDQIADMCGFTDASTFIRSFKRSYGISPAAYRKNH